MKQDVKNAKVAAYNLKLLINLSYFPTSDTKKFPIFPTVNKSISILNHPVTDSINKLWHMSLKLWKKVHNKF